MSDRAAGGGGLGGAGLPPGQPTTTGAALRARQRKRRQVGRHVQWLLQLQQGMAHHSFQASGVPGAGAGVGCGLLGAEVGFLVALRERVATLSARLEDIELQVTNLAHLIVPESEKGDGVQSGGLVDAKEEVDEANYATKLEDHKDVGNLKAVAADPIGGL